MSGILTAYPGSFTAAAGGGGNGLLTSLVAHWDMEETGSADRVDSVTGIHLAATNAPSNAGGRIGNGCNFASASAQYLNCADNATLSMGGVSFSIAMWFKPALVTSTRYMVNKGVTGNFEYGSAMVSARFFFQIRAGGNVFHTFTFVVGNWHLIVATYNHSSGQIAVSVNNGTPETGTESTPPSDGTAGFYVGVAGDLTGTKADGVIDELAIWRGRVLNTTDIGYLWNGSAGLAKSSWD